MKKLRAAMIALGVGVAVTAVVLLNGGTASAATCPATVPTFTIPVPPGVPAVIQIRNSELVESTVVECTYVGEKFESSAGGTFRCCEHRFTRPITPTTADLFLFQNVNPIRFNDIDFGLLRAFHHFTFLHRGGIAVEEAILVITTTGSTRLTPRAGVNSCAGPVRDGDLIKLECRVSTSSPGSPNIGEPNFEINRDALDTSPLGEVRAELTGLQANGQPIDDPVANNVSVNQLEIIDGIS